MTYYNHNQTGFCFFGDLLRGITIGIVLIGICVGFSQAFPFNKPLYSSPQTPAVTSLQTTDTLLSSTMGPVILETYNPVTITIENGTKIYIFARNTGAQTVTVQGPLPQNIQPPNWIQHFFELNPYPTEIAPGDTAVFPFLVAPSEEGSATLAFPFKIIETEETDTVYITISQSQLDAPLPASATIQGRVTTAAGNPMANVDVIAYMFNPSIDFRTQTDADGYYSLAVPSVEDIRSEIGSRPLPYQNLGYSVVVAPEGYTLGYQGNLEPHTGSTVIADLTIDPIEQWHYSMTGEYTIENGHGIFWLYPNATFDQIFAVEGRHPPELNIPGRIIAIDRQGNKLWEQATGDECWGFDVSINGEVAAGSHDQNVYMVDGSGNVKWQLNAGNMNRAVRFTPDGTRLITGPFNNNDAALLDVETGQIQWSYNLPDEHQWLRHARWSSDGQRVIAGFSSGRTTMLDASGNPLWETSIGEFPMVLEIDEDYNSYMAGKNRELFSFDRDGNLRWSRFVSASVVSAGSHNMSADGNFIVMGTVGAWIQAYDSSGNLLWQRRLPGNSQGHNALDMTPDGSLILVGTVGDQGEDGYLVLYNRQGTVLWQARYPDKRDTGELSYSYSYEHPQRGAITVAISPDGTYMAAGFGDGTLRVFERQSAPVAQTPPPVRLGINFPFRGLEVAPLSTYLDLVDQSGAGIMRYLLFADLYWKKVEPTNDNWNFEYPDSSIYNPYDILTVPTLYATFGELDTIGFQVPWRACTNTGCKWEAGRDSSDTRDYVQTVVNRYKDRVKYWEIGNEVRYRPPQGLPMNEFSEFMHLNYQWIKAVDPEAQVLYPGFPGTYGLPLENTRNDLYEFLAEGGGGSFDILSYHDYNSWWTLPAHYDSLKAVLAEFGLEDIPLWCTESSISSDPSTSITPPYSSLEEQAADVWRRPVVLFAKGVEVYFWHSLWSSGGNSNWREFGLLDANGVKKKAFHSYKLLIEKLEHFSSATPLSFGEVTDDNTTGGNGVWVVQFDWEDGTRRWVAWSPDNQSYTLTNISSPQVTITEVVPTTLSNDGETATFNTDLLNVTSGSVELQLSGTPILIEEETTTSIATSGVSQVFALQQNYPNPFNGYTTIQFTLPQREHVTIEVYNILGRKITTLVNKRYDRGTHKVVFDGSAFASGIYFYKIKAGDFTGVKKMMYIK